MVATVGVQWVRRMKGMHTFPAFLYKQNEREGRRSERGEEGRAGSMYSHAHTWVVVRASGRFVDVEEAVASRLLPALSVAQRPSAR